MEATVFLFVNREKMYQFIAKDSEIEAYSLCLNDILKEFRVDIT